MKEFMKAIVNNRYGGPEVLEIKEIERPVPGDDDVLIKVHAAALNAADWHVMRGDPYFARISMGLTKPKVKILGADVSGTVVSVGKSVKAFTPGDAVFGDLSGGGREMAETFGALAEYVKVPSTLIALKPAQLSFEEAAGIPLAAITALQGLRKGKIRSGAHVLINGASGGVGTFAVQIAKAFGAHVTAVCSSSKVEMVRALGADEVIDYTRENIISHGRRYDVILAANGYNPISHYKQALHPHGNFVMIGGMMKQLYEAAILGPLYSKKNGRQLSFLLASSNLPDLLSIKELVDKGMIKPVIEKIYPFHETQTAMRHLEEGHAKGKIVISMAEYLA